MPEGIEFATAVVYVDDVPSTLEFYRRAAQLEPSYYDAELGFALLGERQMLSVASHAAGALMLEDGYRSTPGGRVSRAELAFWSENVDDAFSRAVEAGAAPLTPPKVMPWGQRVAYVEAPEGTILGFLTRMPAAPAE